MFLPKALVQSIALLGPIRTCEGKGRWLPEEWGTSTTEVRLDNVANLIQLYHNILGEVCLPLQQVRGGTNAPILSPITAVELKDFFREPLLVKSSVAHTDLLEVPEHRKATRAFMAARVTYFEGMSQLAIDRQALKPVPFSFLDGKIEQEL